MRDTLKLFTSQSLIEASEALLHKLGIKFTPLVKGVPFNNFFSQNNFNYQYVNEARAAVDTIWHIGYVDDRTFQDDVVGGGSQSLSIFACEIKPEVNFPRGIASSLTRAFTRTSTRQVNFNYDMPVVVIMRQGTLLTLATCELTDRVDGNGHKVGRVTMLRNMDCCNLHAGHKQILERIAKDVQGSRSYDDMHQRWFKSFSIDVLSDDFFNEYKAIYEDIIEYVTGKRMVKESGTWVEHDNGKPCKPIMDEFKTFPDPEKAVRDYVKNLMGRLVFIQFLQKKGWMGVPAGDSWENGDPEFLQNLFKKSDKKDTFIDDVLEPLFNDLNTKRHSDLVTNHNVSLNQNIKVPYLNGGLFELDKSDDTAFPLPSSYMQQLFDFFASYNFTIDENAPDDVEIGVDPEMLGRIFENLLEDNKEKGAYYTRKEIVQYMCRESLIAYLTTRVMKKQGENHRPEEDIRKAVRSLLSEPETIVPKMTKEHLEDFGTYIREVKICDPAIGSGAFPMGLLNELVRCRTLINAWAVDSYGNELVGDIAALKAEIIRNNIYGVDIEKGAIDIARLRFWLSIIVDEKTPEALPNFDYKFMQGNSLIPTFGGEYINLSTKKQNHTKVQDMIAVKQKILQFKKRFYVASGEEKMKLNILIKDHILQLISLQLGYEIQSWADSHREQLSINFDGAEKVTMQQAISQLPEERRRIVDLGKKLRAQLANKKVPEEKRSQIDIQFFDWRMMFTEVFDKPDGGFDIVIGNPPYIQLQANQGLLAKLYRPRKFKTFDSEGDIYCLFYEHGYNLLKPNGALCYITSNKWMRTGYGQKTRTFIKDNTYPRILIDFIQTRLFDDATVETNILLLTKEEYHAETSCSALIKLKKSDLPKLHELITRSHYDWKFDTSDFWAISDAATGHLKAKIKKAGTPLEDWDIQIYRGVLTGYNEAFIISTEKRNEILDNCQSEQERAKTEELIRPILRGRDIKCYKYEKAVSWLINTHNGLKGVLPRIDINDYPSVKRHLDMHWNKILKRADQGDTPYNLRNCAYLEDFAKPKIMWKRVGSILRFTYDEEGHFGLDSTCIATGEHIKFLLAFFNSKIGHFMLQDSPKTGTGDLLISVQAIHPLSVPVPTPQQEQSIEGLIDQILQLNKQDADYTSLVAEIDHAFYKLYGLTNAEVKLIDPDEVIIGADDELFKA